MAYILSKVSILYRATFHKNIIFGPITKITLVKNCGHLTNRTNITAEQRFKLQDNISNDYKLIYREQKSISMTVVAAYNGGWIGLFISVFAAGYLIIKDPSVQEKEMEGLFGSLKPLTKTDRMIMLFLYVITCVLLIVVSKIIPLRIYHNPTQKLYKAIFARNVLGKKDILTYVEGTVMPKFKRSNFMVDSLYYINGRTILLDKECFPVPYVREKMLHRSN